MPSDLATLKPRRAIENMAPYNPPTQGRADKLRLDFNENTVGCSPRVLAYLRERLSENTFSVYPEYGETRAALSRFFSVKPEQLVLTNGTDEAIQLLVNTYVDDHDEVLLLEPSYAMYRFYCEVAGASIRTLSYREKDLAFPLEELLGALRAETRAVFIANPNNPTGSGIDLPAIRRILEAAPQAAVLIDEAYYEFSGLTALDLIPAYPNLFVSRTFSKAYGMAAMRLGCLISQPANADYLRKGQSPYSVNMLAAMAVRAAIEDTEYVASYVSEVALAKQLLYEGLSKLGVPYYPSQANFVLFVAGTRALEIRDKLREKGVLVRDRSYELPGCVRVTIGTREQIRRFLTELERIW
ncbi:MAG: histidinol-phosphate transaminase [Bryobacteraceae bacterium]|nr:histidinol-phosphate transaminase [Bryobacteraceae bacterium]MDW8377935.1 histidinol-phosphate transaminase [Bryobacterales bacterium]